MAKGYLKVNVYAGSIGNPIKNATVTVLKDDIEIYKTITDENGSTDLIELDTVSKNYTDEEQYTIRPYETYDLVVTAFGLNEAKIEDIQIYDSITGIQDVYLSSIDSGIPSEETKITPNTLWGNYPPNIDDSNEENDISPIILKEVVIPREIIVHDGNPNDTNVPNYTVTFTDYIKNVASSEIYSTWPEETIKANILAIISFTLNRIYTEWYRSRGYNFTITSTTTYDQKYTRGGTIYEPISRITDEIFNNYIRSGVRQEPLLAHYKNNTTETGYLSQWGSKELGDKGYNALNILKYYYGDNINIYQAKITETYPYSFKQTLKEGTCNIDVYILQNSLNYIHSSYPGLPIIANPSGYFDSKTKEAVTKFQSIFSLSPTGEVDYQTWYKISYILTAVENLTKNIYNT